MFTNISWTNYTVVIILLISVYYLLFGIRFYSRDLKYFFNSKSRHFESALDDDHTNQSVSGNALHSAGQNSILMQPESSFHLSADDAVMEIERLILRLKEALAEAELKKYSGKEVSGLLQSILKEYPHLNGSPFQSAIDELIRSECEKYGSITLSEEEVAMLWNEVA